jgi:hypothetical protein
MPKSIMKRLETYRKTPYVKKEVIIWVENQQQ